MTTITPCRRFDGQAEEATTIYTKLLQDSRIDAINRAPRRLLARRPDRYPSL